MWKDMTLCKKRKRHGTRSSTCYREREGMADDAAPFSIDLQDAMFNREFNLNATLIAPRTPAGAGYT